MTRELLALLPGRPDLPPIEGVEKRRTGGFTAVFVPKTPPWLVGPALRRHRLAMAPKRQAWIEALMAKGTVLPFAPGSVLDPGETDGLIAGNGDILGAVADRLCDRVQYQVTVTWAEDRVLGRFRAAPEIAPLFGGPTVTGNAVAGAVARLARRLGGTMVERLSQVSGDVVELPRASGMLVNAVLLLRRGEERQLDAALEAIDAIWTDGLRIRQIGPGPAVSFATLCLRRHRGPEIARARAVLGLGPAAPDEAIRQARNRMLRAPGADPAAIRFAARLAEAALHAGARDGPVYLIDLWSEGRSVRPGLERVA